MVAETVAQLSGSRASNNVKSPIADTTSASRFPGEAPLQFQLRNWLDAFQSEHNATYYAAFANLQPKSMVEFNEFPLSSIPPLVLDAAAGITMSMVVQREVLIAEKTHFNSQQTSKADYCIAEYHNALFSLIDSAMRLSAPLKLDELKAAYPIAGCPGMYNGKEAFKALKSMLNAGSDFDHKTHDETLQWMQTVKMPNDTDPDDWAARINEFRRDHFPHLELPRCWAHSFSTICLMPWLLTCVCSKTRCQIRIWKIRQQ